jgi:MtN3 and saliva related transmembrane protein
MDAIEIVGHFGAFLSSVTFIPQVYKAWQTKSVGDLSLTMMIIVFTSTIVWLVYGVSKMIWPVIVCNSVICALSVLLIYFKFTFKPSE